MINFQLEKYRNDGKIHFYPFLYEYEKAIQIARVDSRLDRIKHIKVMSFKGPFVTAFKNGIEVKETEL